MAAEQEQNKSEEATPFKLTRAREKGQVARGMDIGFLANLTALALFLMISGEALILRLAELMRYSIGAGVAAASGPQGVTGLAASTLSSALYPVMLLGGTVLLIVLALEILQLRGLVISAHPLKPDFSRINPAQGFKRIFSIRMLKEALKSILKFVAYGTVTWLVIRWAVVDLPRVGVDAGGLASALWSSATRLLFLFIFLALVFAALDQVIVRRAFAKQMRMSRRELTRENREREGEPRLKQKRKQFHAEFAKQAQSLGKLDGSDMVIVNPVHVAVALAYDPERMGAPTVTVKARDGWAQHVRRRAASLGIPIIEDRPLARSLYAACETGGEIGGDHYREVANLYLKLRRDAAGTS